MNEKETGGMTFKCKHGTLGTEKYCFGCLGPPRYYSDGERGWDKVTDATAYNRMKHNEKLPLGVCNEEPFEWIGITWANCALNDSRSEISRLHEEVKALHEAYTIQVKRAEAAEKERDEARQSAIDSHADAVKAVLGQLREIRRAEAAEVENERVTLAAGIVVSHKEELQRRVKELEYQLCRANLALGECLSAFAYALDPKIDRLDLDPDVLKHAETVAAEALTQDSPCRHEAEAKGWLHPTKQLPPETDHKGDTVSQEVLICGTARFHYPTDRWCRVNASWKPVRRAAREEKR